MKVKLVVIDGEEQKYRCRFFKMTKEKWDADDLEKNQQADKTWDTTLKGLKKR